MCVINRHFWCDSQKIGSDDNFWLKFLVCLLNAQIFSGMVFYSVLWIRSTNPAWFQFETLNHQYLIGAWGAFTRALFSTEKSVRVECLNEKKKLIYWNGLAKTFFSSEKCLVWIPFLRTALMCFSRLDFTPNSLLHSCHWSGVTLLWVVLMCFWTWCFWPKYFLHSWHWNGFSFLWTALMCFWTCSFRPKYILHSWHWNGY